MFSLVISNHFCSDLGRWNFLSTIFYGYIWRVSSQNALYPFWSIWDIWDLSCWNIKKIIRKCNTFDHNFRNIPLYIMSNVSLERYYFVLYDGVLTLKMSKMALNAFCDKTLHMQTLAVFCKLRTACFCSTTFHIAHYIAKLHFGMFTSASLSLSFFFHSSGIAWSKE